MLENDTPDDIQRRMDELRSSLDVRVAQVSTGVRAKTDWRYYVRRYPWVVAGGAVAAGYAIVPRRVEKVSRVVPDADALAQLAKQEKMVMAPASQVERRSKKGMMSSVAAFALAAGSRAAMGYLSQRFGDVLANAEPKRTQAKSATPYSRLNPK